MTFKGVYRVCGNDLCPAGEDRGGGMSKLTTVQLFKVENKSEYIREI